MRVRVHRWLAVALVLGACQARAKPASRPAPASGNEADLRDFIRYRTLRRDDFRGEKLPPGGARDWRSVGATICSTVYFSPRTKIVTAHMRDGTHRAHVEDLGFVALMDRKCSYFKRFMSSISNAYVLRHEQLHFAINEAESRELNSRAKAIERGATSVAETAKAAFALAEAELQRELVAARQACGRLHDEFDRDQKLADTKNMDSWFAEIGKKLAAFREFVVPEGAQETPATPQTAGWIEDPKTGCRVWNPFPQPRETIEYRGACDGGVANGKGGVTWYVNGDFHSAESGDYRGGRLMDGACTVAFANGQSYEGRCVQGRLDGTATLTLPDGNRYIREFERGKLRRELVKQAPGAAERPPDR